MGRGRNQAQQRKEAEKAKQLERRVEEMSAPRKEAMVALLLHRDGRHDEAIARAEELAARYPESAVVAHLAGFLHQDATIRAIAAKDMPDADKHRNSAREFYIKAKQLAPNCVEIATRLAKVRSLCFDREAEPEIVRAVAIPFPTDPAENNVQYDLGFGACTSEARVEHVRRQALDLHVRISALASSSAILADVVAVLDLAEREGAPKAIKPAKELAKRYYYSARANLTHAHISVEFALGLEIDKRPFLNRVLDELNTLEHDFKDSLMIALLRVKLMFVLGMYAAMSAEAHRAIDMEKPTDPGREDVDPGSVPGETYEDRVSSVRTEIEHLLQRLVLVAKDYWWGSLTSYKRGRFLSVDLNLLHQHYVNVYDENHEAAKIISDALSFVKKNRSWRFWICPYCVGKKIPDTDSLLQHIRNKHPEGNVWPKLLSILEPKLISDTSQGDYFSEDAIVCQELEDQYVLYFKTIRVSDKTEPRPFLELRESKCTEGIEILEKIKLKLKSVPAETINTEINEACVEIRNLWHYFMEISVLDFRVVILPHAVAFIWNQLLQCISEDKKAVDRSIDAADTDALFPYADEVPDIDEIFSNDDDPHDSKAQKDEVNQKLENIMESCSVDTLIDGNDNKASEVHVRDENYGATVNEKESNSPTEMVEYGSELDATLENLEADLNYDSSEQTSLPSLRKIDNANEDNATEETASIACYRKSIDVLKENNADEDMYFLNVIIQSLWNLRHFRDEYQWELSNFGVAHEGPCIAEKLYEIFSAWEKNEHSKMVRLLTDVKTTLCEIVNDSNMFQKVGRNFASEIMTIILWELHKFHTPMRIGSVIVVLNAPCRYCVCTLGLFGVKLKQIMSCRCGEWFGEEYRFLHELDASSLHSTKINCFEELSILMDSQSNVQRRCIKCSGSVNKIGCFLSEGPQYFTIVLKDWLGNDESQPILFEALFGIVSPLDITLLYKGVTLPHEGVHSATKYRLASVIYYIEHRYVCFARDQDKWLKYDNMTVKTVDSLGELLQLYREINLQPEVLIYEVIK
uniref:USP domain-containing protein n=1 Tax=Leersia perrieri TaxID=77586 RepID=A0A0D9XCH4_9ORYZ